MARRATQPKEAFVELYDRLGRRLMAYLARRVYDTETAAELWAECWALAFEGWHRCRATSDAEAEAWVFGIARNLLSAYHRSGAIRQRALERLHWSVPPVDGGVPAHVDPGPARTLRALAPQRGTVIFSETIAVDTLPGRTFVIPVTRSGLQTGYEPQGSTAVLGPAPRCLAAPTR